MTDELNKDSEDQAYKQCRFCAEKILKDANYCKHCNKSQIIESKKASYFKSAIIAFSSIVVGFSAGTALADKSHDLLKQDREHIKIEKVTPDNAKINLEFEGGEPIDTTAMKIVLGAVEKIQGKEQQKVENAIKKVADRKDD